MPRRHTPTVCSVPGCPNLAADRGRCPPHSLVPANGSRSGRDLVAHNRWARQIKARDGRCQICGTTVGLEAHHLRPGYDLASGITLCREHHRAADPYAR